MLEGGSRVFTRSRSSSDGRALEEFLVLLTAVGFALVFSYRILLNFTGMGLDHDWDQAMEMHWLPFYTVVHFHQFPFWDPYKCGGMPLIGNPSSRVLTPFFLLHLIFGPLIGVHLEIIAHLAIGFAGAYLLARVVEIGELGALTSGAAFAGSSWYFLHLAPGHLTFMSVMYIPYIFALLWIGVRRHRLIFAAPIGLIAALIFFEGGIYQTTYLPLVLSALAVVLAAQNRSLFPIVLLAAAGAFTLAFSAPKLLPMVHLMGPYGRTVDAFEKNTFSMFIGELFSRDQFFSRDSMGGFWGFWELGAYIGVFFASLAVLGTALRFSRALPWSITALMLLAFAAGNHGEYSPWVLLHRFPPYAAQHAPTRILMLLTLCVAVLAAHGVDAISSLQRPWLTVIVAAVVFLGAADCWKVSTPNSQYLLGGGERESFERSPTFKQVYLEDDHRMFMMAMANLGVVHCYEPAAKDNRAYGSNVNGYRGEQYLIGKGDVSLARWTPNILDYDIVAHGPAVVVVNQNFDPEWKLAIGKGEVFENAGLISIRVPSGEQHLRLEYSGSSFLIGCEIFLVGILSAMTLWVWCGVLGW